MATAEIIRQAKALLFLSAAQGLGINTGAGAQIITSDSCTVSILNQSAFIQEDGSWLISDVPSNVGPVRARVTCLKDGATLSGSSDFFPIVTNRVSAVAPFALGTSAPTPERISVSTPSTLLTSFGATIQLTVTATFTDGSTIGVTSASAGTIYTTTNPRVATVSADGLVTAVASGRVLLTALHEAIIGGVLIDVSVTGDTDGDGLPDDLELTNGLDPNDPVDALEDLDADGLTNRQELVDFGTGIRTADSDSDRILDGEEVVGGTDGFLTNPLLADTDGDGLRDRLEVTTSSDPTNPASYNLELALQAIDITPTSFSLIFNPIFGEVSQQLKVTGRLTDGFDLDLTSVTRGTNYLSSDMAVCNFGSDNGRVFAGANGICTITAQNGGFSAQATGAVRTFLPTALSFLPMPVGVQDIDVNGNFAYVAAGWSGLLVVNVGNRFTPVLSGSLQLSGFAYDVKVVGNLAFVAGGPAGLEIVDISDPAFPVLVGSLDTPGVAQDIAVSGERVLVADQSGVLVVDVSSPEQPILLGMVSPPIGAEFLNARRVDREGDIAVFVGSMSGAMPFNGVGVIDFSDELNPAVIGLVAMGSANDVVLRGRFAFVADLATGFTVIDLDDPARPMIVATIPSGIGGVPADVAVTGDFAFGADTFFGNFVSIVNIANPSSPVVTAFLDFSRFGFEDGAGIAVDPRFVYLISSQGLYIGRYMWEEDTFGIPPTVTIVLPAPGTAVFEGGMLPIRVQAVDDIEVAAVDFMVDDAIVFTDTVPPYSLDLTIQIGTRNLTLGAKATDIGGNASFAQEVPLAVTPNSPASVAIVAPTPGTTINEGGNLSIIVQATDDVGIQAVGLLVDGVAVNTDMTAPYEFIFNVPAGSRSLRIGAGALDIGGLTSFAQEVQVTVTANQPPMVQIVSPATGVTVLEGDRLRISAQATDDLGVASIVFLANGSTVATDVLAPYEAILTVPVGVTELILGATATDALGAETAAADVALTVIPDPGTTVVGRVLDGDRLPVGGANVRCVGAQGLSGSDGLFSITGVPTVQGSVQCVAFGAGKVSGRSAVVLSVLGATTDVGDLILSRRPLYPGAKFEVGDLPIAIVPGDFDGDDLQDLATANQDSADLSVLLGTGDGTFLPEQRLSLDGYVPEDLLAADFNGDGNLDLASVGDRAGDSHVSVFLGNGDGSFLPARSSTAGRRPQSMIAADLDRDGVLDLAIVGVREDYWGTSGLSVLLGNGDGSFAPGQGIAVSDQPASLAVGDFNGDGAADLVTAYPSQDLALLLGNDDGTFRAESRFGQGLGTSEWYSVPPIAAGDFNGDGMMDVVAVQTQTGEVAVLLGNGNGTFQPAISYRAGLEPIAVWPVELNGDDQLDLITSSTTALHCLLEGTGSGNFAPAQCFRTRPSAQRITVTDLNHDRLADFAIRVVGQLGPFDDLAVFMGNGDGIPETLRSVSLKASPQSLAIGDLDRDGSLDIVTANGVAYNPNGVSVRLGRGDGTFESETNYESGALPRSVALGDFNLDGHPDLALADAAGTLGFTDVSIRLGNGDGTFQERQFTNAGTSSWEVRVTDLDADGTPDLVAPQHDNNQVLVLLGNGDGTFRQQPTIGVGSGPVAVTFGDFNRDGASDFVSANSLSQDLSIVLSNGDGIFQSERRVPLSGRPVAIAADDLDSDGVMDLVVATFLGALEVLLSNGDGTFQAAFSYPTAPDLTDVVVADVDQNGQLDLVAVHNSFLNGGEVSVLLGNGDGTFQGRQRFAAQFGRGVGLAAGDLDRDGFPDLVVATYLQPLAILIGGGSPARVGAVGSFTDDLRIPLSDQVCTLEEPALTFKKAIAGVQ